MMMADTPCKINVVFSVAHSIPADWAVYRVVGWRFLERHHFYS